MVTIIDDMVGTNDPFTLQPGEFKILYRKINLKRGMCRRLKQIDVFDDHEFFGFGSSSLLNPLVSYQMTISTFPIIFSSTNFAYLFNNDRMPYAGERHILYKRQSYINNLTNTIELQEYPSPEISSMDDSFFFAPHLYLTVYVYLPDVSETPTTIQNLNFSIYASLEDKKVDRVQYDIGVYQEYLAMMSANELSTGSMIPSFRNAGYFAPSWRYGGKRSSLMASVAAFTAQTTSMFLPTGPNEANAMEARADIQRTIEDSRAMVAFDQPFGNGVPDWFRFDLVSGISSGPLRDQAPPTKYADNGNTLML